MEFATPIIQVSIGVLGVAVIPLTGWAFRLQLKNAELEGRVSVLERYRDEDVKALKEVAAGVQSLLIATARIEEQLKTNRKGEA